MKYTLDDIFIVPAAVSDIDSRSECNPHHSNDMLPLFTAPMTSVVGLDNYQIFKDNKINPIIPRSVKISDRVKLCSKTWCAFSLDEFIHYTEMLIEPTVESLFILIDIANGNMRKLHIAIINAKEKFGDKISIMADNVANPKTYETLSDIGVDYVRIGIGTGSVCITSSNTAIHYPMASLIKECFDISLNLKKPAYIVADGGIKGFGDIEKALALGADYVMCGSVFAKMLESSGETTMLTNYGSKKPINQYSKSANDMLKSVECNLFKTHYGMSTKKAQKEINGDNSKTSEGIEKKLNVEYTMCQWVDNFKSYLKSSMSYTNSLSLYDFIGNVETIIVSNNSYNSVNK